MSSLISPNFSNTTKDPNNGLKNILPKQGLTFPSMFYGEGKGWERKWNFFFDKKIQKVSEIFYFPLYCLKTEKNKFILFYVLKERENKKKKFFFLLYQTRAAQPIPTQSPKPKSQPSQSLPFLSHSHSRPSSLWLCRTSRTQCPSRGNAYEVRATSHRDYPSIQL